MKLELGSGMHPTPGFVHLDVNPKAPDVDLVGDVRDLRRVRSVDLLELDGSGEVVYDAPIADGSVEELRAVDVLEHLSYRDTEATLAEWHRVLVPDGRLYVQVPDAETAMSWYFTNHAKLFERLPPELPRVAEVALAWRLMGGHDDGVYVDPSGDWRWNAHYSLFSRMSLVLFLSSADFEVESCETNVHPNLLCWAVK